MDSTILGIPYGQLGYGMLSSFERRKPSYPEYTRMDSFTLGNFWWASPGRPGIA